MRFPTRRGVFLVATGLPLSFAAITLSESWWQFSLLWLGVTLFALTIDAVFTTPLRAVILEGTPPGLLYIGESDPLTLKLDVVAPWKPMQADVGIAFNDLVRPLPAVTITVGGGDIDVPVQPLRRGLAKLLYLNLRWTGPLGLMAAQHRLDVNAEMPVVPNTRAVARDSVRLAFDDALLGLKQQRRRGQGSEFDALREYGSGMDRRHIDWKHSARHSKLLAKEFDTERNHNIVFAFDSGQLMSEPLATDSGGEVSRLDRSINAGLMMAHICLRAGDKIGMFAFDAAVRRYLAPSGGASAFPLFAAESGRVEQGPYETNFTLGLTDLGRRLERRSLIVVMSEFTDSTTAELMIENLARLSKKHLIMFVTFADKALADVRNTVPRMTADVARAVVSDEMLRERKIVLERLRRLGLLVLETAPETLSLQMIQRYLDIKQRELI
jgi:uncharacterized protein (DUF58 family)